MPVILSVRIFSDNLAYFLKDIYILILNMSVVFHSFNPQNTSVDCSCCWQQLDREAVAHGENNLHPMCKKCAKVWLLAFSFCPICRLPVADVHSLLSKREKAIRHISIKVKEFLHSPTNHNMALSLFSSSLPVADAVAKGQNIRWICVAFIISSLINIKLIRCQPFESSLMLSSFLITFVLITAADMADIMFNSSEALRV